VGKRQESRHRIEGQIVEVGRRQLVASGAANLSVRAIARELGMVSSAVYRYVASRDDLLTLLLVDAYDELADGVEDARAANQDATWTAQLRAMSRAMRQWALDQPARWALLYGSPVPGYHAPAEMTVGPGTRAIGALFGVVDSGIAVGDVSTSNIEVAQSTSADFDAIRAEFAFSGNDAAVARCISLWAALVGSISLEVFGQYGADTLSDPDAVFDLQLDLLVAGLTK
jgi:AcrR family transcriptional regulator